MSDRLELDLASRFMGLLVAGDVHGHSRPFARLIAHARERNLFLVSCGDLVDRGPDSAGCLARMRDLEAAGGGSWIRGNHEHKLHRGLLGRDVRVDEALARTYAELGRAPDVRDWFVARYPDVPFLVRLGDLLVVHGGFGVRMLDLDPLPQPLRARALFGQTARHTRADGRPVRLYRWVDEVPDGLVVVIGHDPCVGDVLLERRGVQGGRMIHLDSAAAKGGPVSALETDRSGRIVGALQADPDGAVLRCVAIEPYDDARTRPDDGASAPGGA